MFFVLPEPELGRYNVSMFLFIDKQVGNLKLSKRRKKGLKGCHKDIKFLKRRTTLF